MNVIQIASAVTAVAVLALALKKDAPVFALLLSLAAGVIILLSLIPQLKSIISVIREIGSVTGENTYAGILFKIIGISYIAQFASDICSDAGERALAGKAVLAGKILVAFYSMPVVAGLIEQINTVFK